MNNTTDYNKVDLQDMVDHLRALGNGVADPAVIILGICRELQEFFNEGYNAVVPFYKDWPKYSGERSYPVPYRLKSALWAFFSEPNLWSIDTQYGRDRRELCIFLADSVEQKYLSK